MKDRTEIECKYNNPHPLEAKAFSPLTFSCSVDRGAHAQPGNAQRCVLSSLARKMCEITKADVDLGITILFMLPLLPPPPLPLADLLAGKHTHTHTDTHTHTHAHIHARMHAPTHTHIHVKLCKQKHTHTKNPNFNIFPTQPRWSTVFIVFAKSSSRSRKK